MFSSFMATSGVVPGAAVLPFALHALQLLHCQFMGGSNGGQDALCREAPPLFGNVGFMRFP